MQNPASNPVEARLSVPKRYHYVVFLVVFSSKIPAIWHVLNLMLLNPPMTYTCGGNTTNECPCSDPVWDRSVFTETVQTKFKLICHMKYAISMSETLYYFGMVIGAVTFGILSDRFGRLLMFCTSYFVTGVAGLLISWSPSVVAFFIFRLLSGFGAGGTIVTSFVLSIETAGTKHREIITALYHIPINIGHILVAVVSYFFRNCFTFQLVISIPLFIYVLSWFFIYESPKWLLAKNKQERLIKTMEKIAAFNNESDPTVRQEIEQYCRNQTEAQKAQAKLYHIFKYKKLTRNFFCMAYLYFVCGMGYYGVSQYISKMSGNVHLNIVISACLVLPGTLASIFLLNKFGRKPLLTVTTFVSGIFMLLTVIIPKPPILKVLCACVSNCFFFMAFIVVFLYGVELFPTQIRNSALGMLSFMSRAGMMTAPQVNALSQVIGGYFFAIMGLIGGVLTFLLPETKNKELPSTMEEAETCFERM